MFWFLLGIVIVIVAAGFIFAVLRLAFAIIGFIFRLILKIFGFD